MPVQRVQIMINRVCVNVFVCTTSGLSYSELSRYKKSCKTRPEHIYHLFTVGKHSAASFHNASAIMMFSLNDVCMPYH